MSKEASYLAEAQALLPHGPAWTRNPEANLTKLLGSFATIYAATDDRVDKLMIEANPAYTDELLTDWERVCALPERCDHTPLHDFEPEKQSKDERRQAVITKLTSNDAMAEDFFKNLAARYGFEIEFEYIQSFICGVSRCGKDRLTGSPYNRCMVYVHITGERNKMLECMLERLKPAHIQFVWQVAEEE